MKLSQLLTAPNQLTLLRMMFVPFIVINLVAGHSRWALVLFVLAGFSDGLDGLLARTLKQQTVLGQYLDPIADKLLLSTMFMVLAILHKIAWKYTVLVFSRDISILCASARALRDCRTARFPSQHLRQGQHVCPGGCDLFCDAVSDQACPLDLAHPDHVSSCHGGFHRGFRHCTTSFWSASACTPRIIAPAEVTKSSGDSI